MTICIVGLGLVGTSVKLAARRAWPDATLVEVERGQPIARADGAHIVVLATPVDVIVEILRRHASVFGKALVLDTGSTKRTVVEAAREAGLRTFVGGHPMAGAASSGPEQARANLFDDRPWFLVPHGATGPARALAHAFVERLGGRPVTFNDDGTDHDRLMAAVSHLPQLVATTLMAIVGDAVGDRGLRFAGTGLRDTTRLASSPASVWEGILATNSRELQPLLRSIARTLDDLAGRLDDRTAVRRLFEIAADYQRQLP